MTDTTPAREEFLTLLYAADDERYSEVQETGTILNFDDTPSGRILLARADEATALRAERDEWRRLHDEWQDVAKGYLAERDALRTAAITLSNRVGRLLSYQTTHSIWPSLVIDVADANRAFVAAIAAPEPAAAPTPGVCVECGGASDSPWHEVYHITHRFQPEPTR